MSGPALSRPLGVLLSSAAFDRAHTALLMSASAAAMGRPVVLFATQGGLHALCRDFSALENSADDAMFRARGVAGLADLRDTLLPMEVRLLACVAGLQAIGLDPNALMDGVEQAGAPSFLAAVGDGQLLSF